VSPPAPEILSTMTPTQAAEAYAAMIRRVN